MTQEDYVSFEVAKLLKEKGYNHYQKQHYFTEDIHACKGKIFIKGMTLTEMFALSDDFNDKKLYAPTLWDVQKWLREKHNISVEPFTSSSGYCWIICKAHRSCTCGTWLDESNNHEDNELLNDWGAFDTYEQALNEGIKEALKMI